MATGSNAMASQMERPVLSLVCAPSDAPFADTLCKAMRQEITQKNNGFIVRQMRDINDAPKRAKDVAVVLTITDWGNIHLSARLDWREGPRANLNRGEALTLSVMDANPNQTMLASFAQNLMTATQNLDKVLRK